MKIFKCDTCGDNLITKHLGIPITISFGFGHNLDGEKYHFCSNKCLLKFIIAEENKENPRKDLEFGKMDCLIKGALIGKPKTVKEKK